MKELGLKPAAWVEQMLASGRESFYAVRRDARTPPGTSRRRAAAPVPENPRTPPGRAPPPRATSGSTGTTAPRSGTWATARCCLEFHTKMNSIDDGIVEMMNKALDRAEAAARGLVIGNDGANFSAGANIMALLMAIKSDDLDSVEKMVAGFQQANQRMRYSPIPVVAAPFGLTLGGGAEVAMGANAIQAAAELYMGLVEVGVGLIPGGGGNLQLLRNLYGPFATDRDFDPLPFLKKMFLTIGTAKVATSAEEAREMGFLQRQDGISLNRDFLLSDAKARGARDGGLGLPAAAADALPAPRPERRGDGGHDALRHAGQQPDLRVRPAHRPEARPRHHRRRRLGRRRRSASSTCSTSSARPSSPSAARRRPRTGSQHMLETGKPLRN